MKKTLFLLLVIFLLPNISQAQSRITRSKENVGTQLRTKKSATSTSKKQNKSENYLPREVVVAQVDSALDAKDYDKAFSLCLLIAERGDAEFECYMGHFYTNAWKYTWNRPLDYDKAFYWYKRSAEHGDMNGQFFFGRMYAKGWGTERNILKCVEWYTKSAEQNNVHAQELLAEIYQFNDDVKDMVACLKWHNAAANNGSISSMRFLGFAYGHGQNGVSRDIPTAKKWFQKAVDAGDEKSKEYIQILDRGERLPISL